LINILKFHSKELLVRYKRAIGVDQFRHVNSRDRTLDHFGFIVVSYLADDFDMENPATWRIIEPQYKAARS
jgi:hypothetical protein